MVTQLCGGNNGEDKAIMTNPDCKTKIPFERLKAISKSEKTKTIIIIGYHMIVRIKARIPL